jgi:hypothetical protein
MIAGETEKIIRRKRYTQYDNYNKLSPEEQAEKKARRKRFWASLGGEFKETGTVGTLLGIFGAKGDNASLPPSDYEIGVAEEKEKEKEVVKKGIPIGLKIIGGIVIISLAAYGVSMYQKNKALKLQLKKN